MSLGEALAGAGGALVAGGLIVVAGRAWAEAGSAGGPLAVTATLLASTAVALVWAGPPARAAAVAASGLTAPAAAFFLSALGGTPSQRVTAVVAGAVVAALYLAGPAPGHTFHLAVLVAAGWAFALSLGDAGSILSGGFGTVADLVAGAGVASMVAGASYLAAGAWLHARGLEGMATPFLGVGAPALALGSVAAVQEELPAAAALVVVGIAVAAVGGWCRRRGTTWTGVALLAAGAALAGTAVDDGRVEVAALVAVVAGVVLVALAPRAAAAVGEGEP